jgi:hypothetical protein
MPKRKVSFIMSTLLMKIICQTAIKDLNITILGSEIMDATLNNKNICAYNGSNNPHRHKRNLGIFYIIFVADMIL